MAKLTNFKAQQVEFPTHYELTDTGRGNNIKNIVPAYGTVREQGTPETSEIYNGLQLGNVHTLQAIKTTLLNIDYYECNLDGLNEFGLNKDLKIRLTVDAPNTNAGAKLRLNDVDYTILKEKNGQLGQIEVGDFKANKTYELTYNGSQFIVINLINTATETEAGLVTLNQIRGLVPTIPEASESQAGLVTLGKIKETVRENAPSLESYENIVNTHAKKQIYSEEGVHGLRYYDDELQVKSVAGEWETAGTGGSGNAPSNVVNPKIKVGNQKLSISWGDPGDTIVNGQTISTWRGTKLVQKVGSYPEKVNDGILLLDNQEKDKYKETPFEVNNLVNGQTYYFALFPYGDKKSVNLSHSNRLKGTPQPFKIMTVKIDMSNSNPETCVTYADDAVGMTPGSDEWDEFFGHYPCLLKATEEQGKLKRDNFRQFENGTPADIRTGDAGDVMIAFPRKGLRIDTTGDIVTVSMTDDPDNSEFKYYAHSRGEERKDKFYVGAYLSSIKNDKARSLRLKDYDPIPRNNDRINFTTDADRSRVNYPFQGRFKAQNNHPNYLAFSFYQLTFIQAMFVLKYKTLTAKNFSQNLKVYNYAPLGEADEYGMDVFGIYGSHIKSVLKIFGLEYLCGQFYAEWIDGIYMKNDVAQSKLVVTTTMAKFHTPARTSDADPNFIERGKNSYNTKGGGGVTRVGGTSELGFVPVEFGGSQTTYFCTENVQFRGGLAFFMSNIFGISFTNVNDEYRCAYRLMSL